MADVKVPEAYVLDPTGNPRKVVGEEAIDEARRSGAQFISMEGASGLADQQVQQDAVMEKYGPLERAGLGAASGLTLGASDVILQGAVGAFGGDADSAGRDLAAIRGTTAGQVGYGAGIIGPALLGDEAGLLGLTPAGQVGRLGGAAERWAASVIPESAGVLGSAASQAVGLAARGAFEGAMFNVADHATNAILTNTELTGQSIAAAGADGALMGGLIGGGIGSVLGAGKLAGRMAGRATEAAGEAAARAGGGTSELEKFVLRKMGGTADDLQKLTAEGRTLKDALKSYSDIIESGGGRIADLGKPERIVKIARESAETALEARLEAARLIDRVEPGVAPNLGRIQQRLGDYLQTKLGTYEYQQVANAVSKEYSRLVNVGANPNGMMEGFVRSRDQMAKALDSSLPGSVRRDVLNILDDEMRIGMESAFTKEARDAGKAYAGATVLQKSSEELEAIVSNKVKESFSVAQHEGFMKSKDAGYAAAGAVFTGSLMGPAAYMAGRSLGRAASRYLEPKMVEWAYKTAIGSRAASATMSAQKTSRSAVAKFFKDSAGKTTGRGARFGAIAARSGDKSVESKGFYETRERVQSLLSPLHRERVKQEVARLEAAGYAAVAASMLQTYDRAAAYLRFNMPPDTSQVGLGKPMKGKWPTQKEEQFKRLLAAVERPLEVIEGIGDGSVSREQMLAIKYVYPDIYSEVVTSVAGEIQKMKAEDGWLDPEKVVILGTVLDAPIDETLQPSYINGIQATFAPPPEPEAPQASPPGQMSPDIQDMLTVSQKGMVQ